GRERLIGARPGRGPPLPQQGGEVALRGGGGLIGGGGGLFGVAARAAEEARARHGPLVKQLAVLRRDAEQLRDHDRRQRPRQVGDQVHAAARQGRVEQVIDHALDHWLPAPERRRGEGVVA